VHRKPGHSLETAQIRRRSCRRNCLVRIRFCRQARGSDASADHSVRRRADCPAPTTKQRKRRTRHATTLSQILLGLSIKSALAQRELPPTFRVSVPPPVCRETGLRLSDIWRYFRHTWVNIYRSVPGRNLMVLVRDRAVSNHPIVGIAALASSVIQQSIRDKWIGCGRCAGSKSRPEDNSTLTCPIGELSGHLYRSPRIVRQLLSILCIEFALLDQ
jgi:hypothetical protein